MEFPPIGHRPKSDSEWIEYALYTKHHKPEEARYAKIMAEWNLSNSKKRKEMRLLLHNS